MSGEHDNIATPERAPSPPPGPGAGLPPQIVFMPAEAPPAPKAPLRERIRLWRATFDSWLAGAPLQPGEIPGMAVFEREAVEVMSRQHTLRARAGTPIDATAP